MPLRSFRTIHFEPALPEPLQPLRDLAMNLWWSWNTDATALFQRINPDTWERTGHNPVRVLQTLTPADFAALEADNGFRTHLDRVSRALTQYLQRAPRAHVEGLPPGEQIAYFSLEYALTECMPIYSGGLGVLAGDHLKSASDLGLPLVAVGLFYHEGYFHQVLEPDGWQKEEYSPLDPFSQPLSRVETADGTPLTIDVDYAGRIVHARVWRVDVGQVPLYLLDTNRDDNDPADRAITSRLYGGDAELRVKQEMLLGIGGVRALAALGIRPAVCHMNEGHSALLGLERIRMLMQERGLTFDEARHPVSAATVFTTHTAVAAGIDLFDSDLMRRQLGHYYTSLGLDDHTFLGLGRTHPDDGAEPFSMAMLGLRLSGFRNGVSRLHGRVSRKLWEAAWPRLPEEMTPIDSVTNGVHLATWIAHDIAEVYDRHLGAHWRDDPARPGLWERAATIPDDELWHIHERQRERLVRRARESHRETSARRGRTAADRNFGQPLDPEILTIGFARRFALYKRSTLLFRDPARLARILHSPDRPVQFIFAGKAHPRDEAAKQLIREVVHHSRMPEFRDRLVVLERYDVDLARSLVQGCDVWMNTPLRPLEASGTSGMKAAANGALHLSVLDGWWAEAYVPGYGWAVGRDRIDDDPEVQDAFDSASLYDLIENEIAGMFYDRDADRIPRGWTAAMKGSIASYAPRFNTDRMVSDYAAKAYGPAARRWNDLALRSTERARTLAAFVSRARAAWPEVKILSIEDRSNGIPRPAGAPVNVEVLIYPGQLQESELQVDAVFGRAEPGGDANVDGATPLSFVSRGEDGVCRFAGAFSATTGGRVGYAVRVLPKHADLDTLATGLVHWS